MGRWEPDARGRLLRAALELFTEHGYEATTAAQIADRAGLTKTTLFRHFADKREIVFQGQQALIAVAVGSIEAAPAGTPPFALLRVAVMALCASHTSEQREVGRTLDPILARSPELQERAVFKRASITAAVRDALTPRLGDPHRAGVLADAGIRAFYEGFWAWTAATDDVPLAEVVGAELALYEALLPTDRPRPARRRAARAG